MLLGFGIIYCRVDKSVFFTVAGAVVKEKRKGRRVANLQLQIVVYITTSLLLFYFFVLTSACAFFS
jgi:hypothetical protein